MPIDTEIKKPCCLLDDSMAFSRSDNGSRRQVCGHLAVINGDGAHDHDGDVHDL